MTNFPGSPRIMRGAINLLEADNGKVQMIITLQFDIENLTRILQTQGL